MHRLKSFSFSSFDVALHEPFGIATGAQLLAENVLVRLKLEDGTVGLGEGAPVSHISGESRPDVLSALSEVEPLLKDRDLSDYRRVGADLGEALSKVPSALQAVEIALFDALCRARDMSLRELFGGAESTLAIDITITTGTVDQARTSAQRYVAQGFDCLKVKIGAADRDADIARLRAIAESAPAASLLLDGNTAYTAREACSLLDGLGPARSQVSLFEQPVAHDDFEGLREVEQASGIPVAADESLRSRADFQRVLSTGGISVINLKTAKLGLLTAWDLLVAGRAAGLDIMVGGMVETEISMAASAALAAGVGGVRYVDLDTPLLLGERPLESAVVWGPRLDLAAVKRGHGVLLRSANQNPPNTAS